MSKKQVSSNAIAMSVVMLAAVSMLSIVILDGVVGVIAQAIVATVLFGFVVFTMRRNRWFKDDSEV